MQDFIECKNPSPTHPFTSSLCIIRHDVDRLPQNALIMAQLESEMNISTTYFFRTKPDSYNEQIIREIAELGHEIGYHYENLSSTTSSRRIKNLKLKIKNEEEFQKAVYRTAIADFVENLEKLRKLYPVKTICMHGSPFSKWDNRDLWKVYNYRDFGIIGEPYFDIDWREVFYLTDTGRRWDGELYSVRDKVMERQGDRGSGRERERKVAVGSFSFQEKFRFRSTQDIIDAANEGEFPDKIMITIHPQRWTDKTLPWVKELIWQNVKNVVKIAIVKRRKGDIENR